MPRVPVSDVRELYRTRRIWIRGHEAHVVGVDFPLVFWEYVGRDHYFHRPFHAIRDVIEVETDDPSAEEIVAKLHEKQQLEQLQKQQELETQRLAAQKKRERSTPGKLRPGLHNMLAGISMQQERKLRYAHESGVRIVNEEAGQAQSVYIEDCHNAEFVFPHKINQVTLLNCVSVRLWTEAVISTVEVITSSQVVIRVGTPGTVNIDRSPNCQLFFPNSLSEVMCFSVASPGLRLIALDHQDSGSADAAAADAAEQPQQQQLQQQHQLQEEEQPQPRPVVAASFEKLFDTDGVHFPSEDRVPGLSDEEMLNKQFLLQYRNRGFRRVPLVRDQTGRIVNI